MARFWAPLWTLPVLALTASIGLAQDDSIKLELEAKRRQIEAQELKLKIELQKKQQEEKEKEKEKAKEKVKVIQIDKGKEKDFEFRGKFNDTDPKDAERMGPSQTHTIKMKAGKAYTIDMVSSELDSYLRLIDSKGNQLDEDDDSGGNLNSRIIFNCNKDGEYKVVCTTFAANMTGNYVLTVKTTVNNFKPSTSHSVMIGKDAPDFKADFALNGDPGKLSDMKGKVVLLAFFEVRSTPSATLLPILAGWNKAHKADGLAIVGLTYYLSDIGQKLAFDMETGQLIGIDKADHKSDQVLLKNYASHHKVEHPLLVLAKQDADTAFDAYAVNSYPQLVLIDRAGKIRMIHVGAKNGAEVESEIKKLVAEK
jgi:hypothetical protein